MTPTIRAAFWMIGTIASFSIMAVAGRFVSVELDTFEIMFFRSLTGIVVVLSLGYLAGTLSQVTHQRLHIHLIRNTAHFAGQNLWFYALTLIPLTQVFALEFTTPIWVTLFAPLFLGERLNKIKMASVALGFAGILIITRPGLTLPNAGTLAAALSAIGFALTALMTKRLTRTETITSILVYLTVIQAILGLVFAAWDGDMVFPTLKTLPWVVLIGLAGLTAHFCLTKALTLAPASVVVPIDFARLPAIAVVGWMVYAEAVDLYVAIGAALIFAGTYVNVRAGTRDEMSRKRVAEIRRFE